jgi:hypothetical protein
MSGYFYDHGRRIRIRRGADGQPYYPGRQARGDKALSTQQSEGHVSIIVANLKGDNAWGPFQGVAHWYRSGVRTAVMRATVEMLRDQVEEMNRRQGRQGGRERRPSSPDHPFRAARRGSRPRPPQG